VIHGILLAAGMGRRLGSPKALVRVHGTTFHERAVGALESAGLDVVTVVNPLVEAALPAPLPHEVRVLNPDPDQEGGMFSSVRLGVAEALKLGANGAVLLPVDHPFVTGTDVQSVREGLLGGAAIVVATHGGRRGHPIGISRAVMDEILAGPEASTLRDVVRRDPGRVKAAPASLGALLGVNTKDDLAQASERTFR
jgi:CTP:molybdopterin cytidylyltransferase MocA